LTLRHLLIPKHHVTGVVNERVEAISDEGLFFFYKGGGRSAYHLKMMFKVLLFSYSQKVFSCRDIENATK